MVERTEAQTWKEFKGEVVEVSLEQPKEEDRLPQYHIQMKVLDKDKEIKGKTGLMHEWIRLPGTATETTVPRGSVVDRYLEALEDLHSEIKKLSVKEAFELMKGKTYTFKSKVLGRAFQNNPAAEYWVPVKAE